MIEPAKAPLAQYPYLVSVWPSSPFSLHQRYGASDYQAARQMVTGHPIWQIRRWDESTGRHQLAEEST